MFVVKTTGNTLISNYYCQKSGEAAEQQEELEMDCESVLSDDSFLMAIDNRTVSIENCTDPVASPVDKSVQTDLFRLICPQLTSRVC